MHDMREILRPFYFDYIFNLFTSFGYFDSLVDDEKVLNACHEQLKPGGHLILDYFNVEKILDGLPFKGIEHRGDIDFKIEKNYSNKQIVKAIDFEANGNQYHFTERVSAYTLEDFELMFQRCGFEIKIVFGNYLLEKFSENSERVIIIAEKK